ncbi:hypothetical protein LCGC14_2514280 [marine sediment metagenome]|uniref:Uncharacterized protein n=1 Tax=marine sediment metagenome TaxID=412755 RepID=A0A0F9D9X9_9ZZZZ
MANSLPTGHKLGIHPFNTYSSGFAFSQRPDSRGNLPYLSFFPSPDNALASQVFSLGKEDFSNFGDSYIKILGGLLVDHQTFVIEEIDSSGGFVRHLIAFNIFGTLALESDLENNIGLYIPRPHTSQYFSSPSITSFDDSLYNTADPNSIVNILKEFYENNNLIGYQRIGD